MVFIQFVGFPPRYILMPISTTKQHLAIPIRLVLMSKSHCMTLPVLFPLQWLWVSVTDEYKTDGMVAEPHQIDLMGLKLPMVLHRLVSCNAGLCILILKDTQRLQSFILSCPNVRILILTWYYAEDILKKMHLYFCVSYQLSVVSLKIARDFSAAWKGFLNHSI